MKLSVILAISMSVSALSGCDAFLQHIGERNYYELSDGSEAFEAGVIERGWLPEWLPKDIENIHLYYDLDTNERALSFDVANAATFKWFPECVSTNTATKPRLRTRLFPRSVHRMSGLKDCVELYAVRDKAGRIHLWTKPGDY